MTREAVRVYTIAQAAEVKAVSQATLLRAIHAKEGNTLAAKKVGKGYRVTAPDLDAWYDRLADA